MGARPDRRLLALLQVQVARPLVITKHVLFPGILAPRDARRAASLRVQATLWRFRWEARTVARRRPTLARRVAVGRLHSHTLGITVAIWALGGAGTGDGLPPAPPLLAPGCSTRGAGAEVAGPVALPGATPSIDLVGGLAFTCARDRLEYCRHPAPRCSARSWRARPCLRLRVGCHR